ncbi:MAG: hypothetical protein ACRC1K_22430, partial [Planctomycetia bacterium]
LLPAVLVMGLPIVDTLLAIIRRWIRHLPWNVADHGHLHHRLLAFGLTPRQASFFLYSFTVVLASAALSSVVMRSDALAVLVAVMGTVGLGTVFAARREERASFLSDLMQRLQSRRLEQRVARVVWESIQRLANCHDVAKVLEVGDAMAARLRCDEMRLYYQRRRTELVAHRWTAVDEWAGEPPTDRAEVGGGERQRVQLRFALTDDRGEHLFVEFKQNDGADVPLWAGGRFLSRYAKELNRRLRALTADAVGPADVPGLAAVGVDADDGESLRRREWIDDGFDHGAADADVAARLSVWPPAEKPVADSKANAPDGAPARPLGCLPPGVKPTNYAAAAAG